VFRHSKRFDITSQCVATLFSFSDLRFEFKPRFEKHERLRARRRAMQILSRLGFHSAPSARKSIDFAVRGPLADRVSSTGTRARKTLIAALQLEARAVDAMPHAGHGLRHRLRPPWVALVTSLPPKALDEPECTRRTGRHPRGSSLTHLLIELLGVTTDLDWGRCQ
jgi:hypothetical protein